MPVEMVVESIRVSLYAARADSWSSRSSTGEVSAHRDRRPRAEAIAIKMQNHEVPRPLTHDLLCTMIQTSWGA